MNCIRGCLSPPPTSPTKGREITPSSGLFNTKLGGMCGVALDCRWMSERGGVKGGGDNLLSQTISRFY